MRRLIYRAASACAAGLAGVFLSVRCKAFLIAAWGLDAPVWSLAAFIAVAALAGFVFYGAIGDWLRRWAFFPRAGFWAACAVCVPLTFLASGIVLLMPLDASGVTVGALSRAACLAGAGILLAVFLLCLTAAIRDCLPGARAFFKTVSWRDIVFLAALLVTVNLLALYRAKCSATIYFWDNAGYWTTAQTLAALWRDEGSLSLLRAVYASVLSFDYNYLIALPSALFARVFGPSHSVFILSIVNADFFPICLLVWGFAKARCRRPPLSAATALLCVPMLFYSALYGFVDVGGCAPAMGALMLCLSKGDRKNDFGRFLIAGLLLALALLLRRWFAFFALSFILALAADCLFFRRSAVPLLGALASFAFTLLFFFQTLVSGKLLADYGSLYSAYMIGLGTDFLLLFRYFGILPLVFALFAAALLILRRESRPAGVLLLLQPVLCFLLFVRVQTHAQQHLLLYAPALLCLFTLTLARPGELPRKRLAASLTLALALAASLSPFWPRVQPMTLEELTSPAVLPSFPWAAEKRGDAYDIAELMRRLDSFGEDGKSVGVLASSFTINRDILLNAEASLSLPRVSDTDRGYLLYLPAVDGRDGWSDTVFDCDVLVVGDPVQLHLGEENQAVVALPAERLLSGEGMGAAFVDLGETWTLDGGVTVRIFEKLREITPEEQDELRSAFHAAHPG